MTGSPETAAPHALINGAPARAAAQALARCCGARRWVEGMLARRPFASTPALLQAADEVWSGLARADYLEAFAHHPAIGADLTALRARFGATASWSRDEQQGVIGASEATLEALRAANLAYEARFGYLFIVCASGKRADQLLAILQARLTNDPERELAIAAAEQAAITRMRLEKLT